MTGGAATQKGGFYNTLEGANSKARLTNGGSREELREHNVLSGTNRSKSTLSIPKDVLPSQVAPTEEAKGSIKTSKFKGS